jgi:hypothetical protein
VVSVFTGWAGLVIAAVAWSFADVNNHPFPGYAAAALGVLLVGLIHTRTWRSPNPWGKRTAR